MIADPFMITSYVKKYWEINQEEVGHFTMIRGNCGDNVYHKNKDDGKVTILGHEVKLVGAAGIRMIFEFTDGTKHKVEIDMKELYG